MREQGLELAILTRPEHVQWLSGVRLPWFFEVAAALTVEGRLVVAAPERQASAAAADEVVSYPAQWHSTLRNDQSQALAEALVGALGGLRPLRRVGVEFSAFGRHLAQGFEAEFTDLEPDLYRLRRRKDPDELALIRKAIAGTQRMYRRAREVIAPGFSELEVFNELQAAAVEEFGEPMTATGNDYQCASRGGPPRDGRRARAGELYVLDLGPAFRGYFADNARTVAVTEASGLQQEAWAVVTSVLEHVKQTVRPGKSARELYHEARAILEQAPSGVFDHHLGHGIGLFPHEAPHLNPNWDDTFQEGEVFAAEPGLYSAELKAGIRIENDYLVTADGVELLTPFPTEL